MRFLLGLVLLVSACIIDHRSDGDDDDGGGHACPAISIILLDPQTGTCQAEATCDPATGEDLAKDEASCHSTCESLTEASCISAAGCRASYVTQTRPAGSGTRDFFTCEATPPSGPVHTGACGGLTAQDCSRHDNCAALYFKASDGSTAFSACLEEPVAHPAVR